MIKQKSLKRELNRWIIITALFFVLLGTGISGMVAYNQARELQDNTLLEIASLIKAGKLNESTMIHHDIAKDTIIINELGPKQHVPIMPLNSNDGFHTMLLNDQRWRMLVISRSKTNRRYSISQQTKIRDEIALKNSLAVLIPLLLLIGIMLIIIHFVINRQFKQLSNLATIIDQQDSMNPQVLTHEEVPIEITPFINSINGLLIRIRSTLNKQQRFIADAAHELRTPITALSLQVENISPSSDKNTQETHQQLQQGVRRIGTLVSQLLDLARLQNNNQNEKQEVSFNNIIKDSISSLYPLAEQKKIDLGVIKQEQDILTMDIQGKLHQLVFNAIDNAINYTPQGGRIDISLYTQNNSVVFLVEDNGIGIPENELEHVTEPFYRVNEAHVTGNGLGLAISNEIAQQLGGEIYIENRKDGGISFKYEQSII
jgi:signal transduction histidine kinase